MCACDCMCLDMHGEVKGQFWRVASCLPPLNGFWEWNLGHQAFVVIAFTMEPSQQQGFSRHQIGGGGSSLFSPFSKAEVYLILNESSRIFLTFRERLPSILYVCVHVCTMASIVVLLKLCCLSRLQLNVHVTCVHSGLRYGIAAGGLCLLSPGDLTAELCVGMLGICPLSPPNNFVAQPSRIYLRHD